MPLLAWTHSLDGRILKDHLYEELSEGIRPVGHPKLCFKDIVKQDLKKTRIKVKKCEDKASVRFVWWSAGRQGVQESEVMRKSLAMELRWNCKQGLSGPSQYKCKQSGCDCHSQIGLLSHSRKCSNEWSWPSSFEMDTCQNTEFINLAMLSFCHYKRVTFCPANLDCVTVFLVCSDLQACG